MEDGDSRNCMDRFYVCSESEWTVLPLCRENGLIQNKVIATCS